jgi:hypothetical protein
MTELLHKVVAFLLISLVIFVLNVIPIFAPPTWTVLSFIAITYESNIIVLAIVGAVAATLGRLTLAKLSRVIVRQKFPRRRHKEQHRRSQRTPGEQCKADLQPFSVLCF